jgi:transposase-like protein
LPGREHFLAFKHKYSFEEKERIILEYQSGVHGFLELCRIYGMAQGALKDWIRLYETFGMEGLRTGCSITHYPKETKEAAVQDYLMHKLPVKEILKKYKMRSATQLRKWVKKYNGHEELKTSGTGGSIIMTKGRKTSFDERVEIVQYCIAHDHNYTETSEKYGVSYQQARSYTVKYQTGGVEALKDRRGRSKPEAEMSELEKLRAENRILRAEKEQAEMEASFLKKLEEIERRWG